MVTAIAEEFIELIDEVTGKVVRCRKFVAPPVNPEWPLYFTNAAREREQRADATLPIQWPRHRTRRPAGRPREGCLLSMGFGDVPAMDRQGEWNKTAGADHYSKAFRRRKSTSSFDGGEWRHRQNCLPPEWPLGGPDCFFVTRMETNVPMDAGAAWEKICDKVLHEVRSAA
jgi:hypothetical protein